ncbi:Uncharacterized protein HZ326_26376 [Fusarium oxysporum f. sp. albedinis]|nr:Uncharacterized protein HZ326_26376 [Fusarium oxysporum f. sp. albedinis]
MDIHPAFAMAQSAAPPMDPMYAPSAIDNFGTVSHPAWEQCWSADQPNFPGPSEAAGGDAQHEYDIEDFVLNYGYTSASTNLTGSIFSQEYPTPPETSELTSPEKSPSNSDGRRHSSSTQSDKQKRKPNHTERAPAKSSRRDSTKKAKARAKAAAEVHENTKKRCSINEAAATNLSSPHFKNNAYTRKVQERNRIASNKFRIRKQEDERKLKSAEKDMEQINRELSTCATDLTLQVYNLKMKLLQHTDCDCALIQEYIANEAHRYIQDLGDKEQCQQP